MGNNLVPSLLGMIDFQGTELATSLPVTFPLVIVLLGEHFHTKNDMPSQNMK